MAALATLAHVLYAGAIGLSPQEAYYWQWSRHLDLSYFDHPPLAAWTIALATALFGSSERAIRLAAALHSAIFCLFFFLAGRRLFGPRAALAALTVALLTPLFSLGQTIITPDAPLVAGWTAALYFTLRALEEQRGPWLLAAGAAVGFAVLGKYTGFILLPQIFLALLLDDRGRRLLRSPWPWLGLVLAVALFSPVLVWNARHGWVSFGFQFAHRADQITPFSARRVLAFLGLQSLVVTPVLFAAVLAAAAGAAARWRQPAMRLCALFSVPLVVFFVANSPFSWVKSNWLAAAYPAALLAAAGFWAEAEARYRALAAVAVTLAFAGTVYMHLVPVSPRLPFPAKDEAWAGWRDLAARVQVERSKIAGPSFVAGCYYKTASTLAYYLPGRPETYSSSIFDEPGLQYALWQRPQEIVGREGIVAVDPRDKRLCLGMREFCRPLQELDPLTVRRGGQVVTTFLLYRCRYAGSLVGANP